jgi:hypothetical protein
LTPLVRGSPQAPRMPERFAIGLALLARRILGGATSFRVATRSLHRSRAGGLKALSRPRMGGLKSLVGLGRVEKSDFLQKSNFWAEVTSIIKR